MAYPFWMMVAGPQRFSGTVQNLLNPYHNDLLSFVAPGPLQRLSLGLRALGVRLIGFSNPSESGGYVGLPVLIIAGLLAFASRRTERMQLSVLLVCAAGLISLGPYLSVDGRMTNIPLPDLVLSKVPLLDNLLPVRVSFEVDACLAAVVAFGLDDRHRAPLPPWAPTNSNPRIVAILASLVAAAIAVTQLPYWPYASQPSPAFPAPIRDVIPPGDPIAITYPYTGLLITTPMDWQAQSGFDFRLSGGYSIHPGPTGLVALWPNPMTPPGLQRFLASESPPTIYGSAPAITPRLVTQTRQALAQNDIRLVVVQRSIANSQHVVQLLTRAIGPPRRSADGFVVWSATKGTL